MFLILESCWIFIIKKGHLAGFQIKSDIFLTGLRVYLQAAATTVS